jgi:hypothetical protein
MKSRLSMHIEIGGGLADLRTSAFEWWYEIATFDAD